MPYTKPYPPVTDRNEDGSATVCSQCERPDECGLTEVAHASGPLHLCGVCFDELTPCENCGERGGVPKEWVEIEDEPEAGKRYLIHGCSLCEHPNPHSSKCPDCETLSDCPDREKRDGRCVACWKVYQSTSEECPF